MTIGVSVVNEDGAVEAINSYDDLEEAFGGVDVLIEFGYVTEDRPAILSYKEYEAEIRPKNTPSSLGDESLEEWSDEYGYTKTFSEGQVVTDTDAPDWAYEQDLEVIEHTDIPANLFVICQEDGEVETVADMNPDFPETDRVVIARPINSKNDHAYPESRLEA